jgi:hypothetical protein
LREKIEKDPVRNAGTTTAQSSEADDPEKFYRGFRSREQQKMTTNQLDFQLHKKYVGLPF